MVELFQITVGKACFGLVTTDRVVTLCAPYGKKDLLGRSSREVMAWVKARGGTVIKIRFG